MKVRQMRGYEDKYLITSDGRIFSKTRRVHRGLNPKKGQIVKGRWRKLCVSKYVYVSLGAGKSKTVHRLVAETFIPNPKKLPQVNHINGDKTDNRVENLEWCTAQENIAHAMINGLAPHNIRGENNAHAKLSDNEVKNIRELYHVKGKSCRVIAREFSCSRTHVSDIVNNKARVVY